MAEMSCLPAMTSTSSRAASAATTACRRGFRRLTGAVGERNAGGDARAQIPAPPGTAWIPALPRRLHPGPRRRDCPTCFEHTAFAEMKPCDPWAASLSHLERGGDWVSALQYRDLHTYLPLDILTKVDRMTMAHSIEARPPLLDHHLVEFAATIPCTSPVARRHHEIPVQASHARTSASGHHRPAEAWIRRAAGTMVQRTSSPGSRATSCCPTRLGSVSTSTPTTSNGCSSDTCRAAISICSCGRRCRSSSGAGGFSTAPRADSAQHSHGDRPIRESSSLPRVSTSSAAREYRPAVSSERWRATAIPVGVPADQSTLPCRAAMDSSLALSSNARQPGAVPAESPAVASRRCRACLLRVVLVLSPCAHVPRCWCGRLMQRRVILHYHSGEAADHLARWGVLVHPWLKLADEIVVPSEYLAEHLRGTRPSDSRDSKRREPVALRVPRPQSASSAIAVDTQPGAALPGGCRPRGVRAPEGALPDATLTVAGYGSEEARLKRLATRGGTFRREESSPQRCRSCTRSRTSS